MLFTRRSHNRSVFAAVCVAWGREHSKELGQIKKAVTLKKVMAKMCGIEKWFVLHFSTNHFVHKKLTKYFSKKLKFFRVAHSKLGAKALSFSSSPHRKGKRWEDIFFSCSQKWTRKNPETVAASGFSGAISFLVAQCGCGDRTRTCDLRVMSPTSYQLLYSAISTFVVPVTGLEPVQYRYRGILSPLCLPIPPHRQLVCII